MSIPLACRCGKTLRVADEHAGKRLRCKCGAVLAIPAAPPIDSEEPAPEPRRRPFPLWLLPAVLGPALLLVLGLVALLLWTNGADTSPGTAAAQGQGPG